MQELHFVGFTSNQEGLLLSRHEDATSGDYFVQIDEYLAAAIEQRPGASPDGQYRQAEQTEEPEEEVQKVARRVARTWPKPGSNLNPREIQARLRGGSSVAEVAEEAGVDEDWVLRFADPIVAEQARVVQHALQLTFTKPRVGPSAQPLRNSVRWNLADQGALRDDEVFDAGWIAFNLHGSTWVVRFSFSAKRRRKLAEWEVDLRQGELKARNRVATDLGYVEPGRRRKPPPDELEFTPAARPRRPRRTRSEKAAQKVEPNKGGASKAITRAPKRAASKKTALKKTAAKTTGVTKGPPKSAPRKSPPKKSAPKKSAPKKSAPKRTMARKKATAKKKAAGGKKAAASAKGPSAATLHAEWRASNRSGGEWSTRPSWSERPRQPASTPSPVTSAVGQAAPPLVIMSTPDAVQTEGDEGWEPLEDEPRRGSPDLAAAVRRPAPRVPLQW